MEVAIYGKLTKNTRVEQLCDFLEFLHRNHINYRIFEDYAKELQKYPILHPFLKAAQGLFKANIDLENCAFLFSIGGDGTLLNAVYFSAHNNIPIVGVNAGRLGFLASVYQSELVELTRDLIQNVWKEERRMLLEVEAAPVPILGDFNYALNEITIHKSNSNEMIVIHTYINGEFLNSYWADGLIISTPTGSTAYSLACGGPIMTPQAGTFVITPIAPHSLTVRPMIVPDTSVISFGIESRSGQALVAVDNRTVLVENSIELAVRKSDKFVRLVRAPFRSYFTTLRDRLNWGVDSRK